MKILAVDTTFGACSVAVRDGPVLLARSFERMDRGHAEALAPMVERTMKQSGLAFGELDRLGVTTGPGTFTGQRVGLAFMRGLRLALRRPLIGMTSLRAMGEQARSLVGCGIAATVQDARREEFYFEVVADERDAPKIVTLPDALSEVAKIASGKVVALAGTAREKAHEAAGRMGLETQLAEIVAPDADWVAQLCAEAAESAEVPKALYLREPDAKRPPP